MTIQEVKEAARGRGWRDVLAAVGGFLELELSGDHGPCPQCGGKDRFRFTDHKGDGAVYCSQCFTDGGDGIAAIAWRQGISQKEAADLVAEYLGLEAKKPAKRSPLKFLGKWSERLAAHWCSEKPGIHPSSLVACGARRASYSFPGHESSAVFALPIQGSKKVIGHAIFTVAGGKLPAGKGGKERAKTKVIKPKGSGSGWLGLTRPPGEAMAAAAVVWKVEGVSDLLALTGAVACREDHLVVSNPMGASETPKDVHLEGLAGKAVIIVADRDEAGRQGARVWAAELARVAKSVRVIEPPGGEGTDLRDFFAAGGRIEELAELVKAAPLVAPAKQREWWEDLAPDCPNRLAREYVSGRGRDIRAWNQEIYSYQGGRYVRLKPETFAAWVEAWLGPRLVEIFRASDEEGKRPPRLSDRRVQDVVASVLRLAQVDGDVQWGDEITQRSDGTWKKVGRRTMASFENGALDIERAAAGLVFDEFGLLNIDATIESGCLELEEHSPKYWSTIQLPYSFDPRAEIGSMWLQVYKDNLGSDPGRARLIQEFFGYCFAPNDSGQKCLAFEGDGGSGKSVVLSAIEATIGAENCSHVELSQFNDRFSIERLEGKLLNISTEVDSRTKLPMARLKTLVSGETVMIERKNRQPYESRLPVRFLIAWNERPKLSDSTGSVWRRFLIVPFKRVIPEGEKIQNLDTPDWWVQNGECPGLFMWALEGLRRLRDQSGAFSETQESKDIIADFRSGSNPEREFLLEHYEEVGTDRWIPSSEIFQDYESRMTAGGYSVRNIGVLMREIEIVFPRTEKVRKRTPSGQSRGIAGLQQKVDEESFCG